MRSSAPNCSKPWPASYTRPCREKGSGRADLQYRNSFVDTGIRAGRALIPPTQSCRGEPCFGSGVLQSVLFGRRPHGASWMPPDMMVLPTPTPTSAAALLPRLRRSGCSTKCMPAARRSSSGPACDCRASCRLPTGTCTTMMSPRAQRRHARHVNLQHKKKSHGVKGV